MLKSCPFCGGDAKLITDKIEDDCWVEPETVHYAKVQCSDCKVRTKKYSNKRSSVATEWAMEDWNDRV